MEIFEFILFSVIQLVFRLVCLGLILSIYILTFSEFTDTIPDNPFTNEEIKQINYNNYIYSNQCKCSNEIFNGICTQEQEILGCVNLKPKSEILRNLQDKPECLNYYQLISGKEKISEIFNLNIPIINLFALIQLCVLSFAVISNVFMIIYMLKKSGQMDRFDRRKVAANFGVVTLVTEVVKFALLITFWVFYGKGQIIEYLDMLDCPDFNTDSFIDYTRIDRADDCIISFLVFNTHGTISNIFFGVMFVCECDIFD